MRRIGGWTAAGLGLLSLATTPQARADGPAGTFGDDLTLVNPHTPTIILSDPSHQSRVMVAPALQGRVLTSTADGDGGISFGWINKELLASGEVRKHINAYGGEDRFWIGPEGGQFSIFFAPGSTFDLDHWQTPAPLDTEPFDVVDKSDDHVAFRKEFGLTNYSGTAFKVRVERDVRLLAPDDVWKSALHVDPAPNVKVVAFETVNRLTNAGDQPWTKQTGLLSIWVLGQMNASPKTTVVVPFKQGPEADLGKEVESSYFGVVPPDRLRVADGFAYFKTDAKFRSKIGVNPKRAMPTVGSYDAANHVLTLIQHTMPGDGAEYVNSLWKIQDNPFSGDEVNSYNDGPAANGASLGDFYEIESSSPAAALAPGQTMTHTERTMHLEGDEASLDAVAHAVLGVGVKEIATALDMTTK